VALRELAGMTRFRDALGRSSQSFILKRCAAERAKLCSRHQRQQPQPVCRIGLYGPWTQQIDLGLTRRFNLTERPAVALQVQVFNVMNHANYYVQNGTGVDSAQYTAVAFGNKPDGSTTCGDGVTSTRLATSCLNPSFGQLQVINALNGPRVMQFALKWTF
jgi:hypothetical protein